MASSPNSTPQPKTSLEGLAPAFVTVEGLQIRYLSVPREAAETVVLLSPWPESLYAYAQMWPLLAEEFALIAVDLPGFGQSASRPDLFGPRAMGGFIPKILQALGVNSVHAVGPDIGTAALLFAALAEPQAFASI